MTASKALVAALAEMRSPAFDRTNSAFKGFKYASLASFVEAARDALGRHKLALIQPIFSESDEGGPILVIHTRVIHESGEAIELGRFPFRPDVTRPQSVGATLTYFRRYSLAAALGIVADDDHDGNDAVTKGPQRVETFPSERIVPASALPSQEATLGIASAAKLRAQLKSLGLEIDELRESLEENGHQLSPDPSLWKASLRPVISAWLKVRREGIARTEPSIPT